MQGSKARARRNARSAIGVSIVALAAQAGLAAPALAQSAAPAAQEVTRLDDIVVTANKRSESIQDVPVSVVAITPRVLAETGVVSTTQLQQTVPAFSFSPSGEIKLNSFYIRGVGTYALSAALESSVGVAVDGVPLARVGGSISDLVDIERVEVLKGPQGMLFGKNATAGLIGVVTRKPQLGVAGGAANLAYGSFNELNIDATLNAPIGDRAAMRLTAWRFGHDGFVHGLDGRDYGDKNSYGARLGLTVEPTSALQLTLVAQADGRDEHGVAFTYREFTNTAPFGSVVEAWETSRGVVPSPTNLVADPGPMGRAFARNYAVTGLADLDLGGGYTLSSATSYRKLHSTGQMDPWLSSAPLVRINQLTDAETYDQFTQEVRITSPTTKPMSFVAGLFYYDFSIHDVQDQAFFGVPVPGSSSYPRRNTVDNSLKNLAAFGEATLRVTPNFRLIAGLRQSKDRVTGFFDRARIGPDAGVVPATVPIFSFRPAPIKYDATSYRFGAQYDLADDVMVYATASRGYKAPGFNLTQSLTPGAIVNDARVEAEIAKSYEVGIKSQFFDRRLTLNVTAFDSTFSNFQTTVGLPVSPPVFVIQNAGELKSTGVEFDLSARPTSGLSIGLNGAYVDARYTDFDNAACYPLQPTLPAGSAPRPGYCVGGVQTLDGWPLAQSPRWSFNASARYERALGATWKGFIGGNYAYRGKTYYEANRNPREVQSGYGFLNLTAGAGPSDDSWSVSIYARNVLGEDFVARVRNNFNSYYQMPAYESRRRLGVQLAAKF
jgi:iron complex outermembrane receptor protein